MRFAFHPWVKSVGRIAKQPPNRMRIELEYRVPLAAVGHAAQPGVLLLADSEAFRLPEADLTAAELRHLPRVTLPSGGGQAGKPLLGETLGRRPCAGRRGDRRRARRKVVGPPTRRHHAAPAA